MRKLKHHEKKLLRKTDFLNWKLTKSVKENSICQKYRISNKEDYIQYRGLRDHAIDVMTELRNLPADDSFRIKASEMFLNKLYELGVISSVESLADVETLSASSFCRRRLPVVLVNMKFAPHLQAAVEFVEQGHIRIGSNIVHNTSYHVTRTQADKISWAPGSLIGKKVQEHKKQLDEY